MRLRDLLDESVVKTDLESLNKEECFEELIDLLVRAGRITDRAGALKAIVDRETQASTGIGKGVAVPHGKHQSVTALAAALGISKSGIEFESVDGQLVHVVFLILARVDQPGPHVHMLAEIASLVRTRDFCRKLREAEFAKDVLDILDLVK